MFILEFCHAVKIKAELFGEVGASTVVMQPVAELQRAVHPLRGGKRRAGAASSLTFSALKYYPAIATRQALE